MTTRTDNHRTNGTNELDSKLLSFSKMVSKDISRDEEPNSETIVLMDASRDDFERLIIEIDAIMCALTDVNNQMSRHCKRVQNASATNHILVLQRHRQILHDYSNEFHKTRNNIEAQLNRELLLGPHKKDTGY